MSDHADVIREYVDDTELFLLRGGNTDPRVAAVRAALDALVAELADGPWKCLAESRNEKLAAAEEKSARLTDERNDARYDAKAFERNFLDSETRAHDEKARAEVAEAERDEARRERDSWRTLAEGWKLTDDVERHRV